MKLSDITTSMLMQTNTMAHYFGLGFIQIKLSEEDRLHFYHPSLPTITEDPHDHRYDFLSYVLRGRLVNQLFEENLNGTLNMTVEDVSCEPDMPPFPVRPTTVRVVGSFVTEEGSSYHLQRDVFHTVAPDFRAGPCVTHVVRSSKRKLYARVLRDAMSPNRICPFSKKLSDVQLWTIVNECLAR